MIITPHGHPYHNHMVTPYLHVRSVAAEVRVQRSGAVPACEALLVVDIVHAHHLLSGEHLVIKSCEYGIYLHHVATYHSGTARTSLLPVLATNCVSGNIGLIKELGLGAAPESPVADPAVDLVVGTIADTAR